MDEDEGLAGRAIRPALGVDGEGTCDDAEHRHGGARVHQAAPPLQDG